MNRKTIIHLLASFRNQEISKEELLEGLQSEGVDSYNISLNDLSLTFKDEETTEEESVHLLPQSLDNKAMVVDLMKQAGVDHYEVSISSGHVKYYDEQGGLIEGIQ